MPTKVRELTIEEMIELRRQGVTLQEIGDRLGISRQRVQQIIGNTREIKPRKTKTPEERKAARAKRRIEAFWSHVSITAPDKCWEWQGCINVVTGYGRFSFMGRRTHYAHRLAYEFTYGKIPGDKHILHSCDNPKCCNPSHLRIGTPKENVEDRGARGRTKSKCGGAAFYRQRSKEIVELYSGKLEDIPAIAEKYGVSGQMVYSVVCRARREKELTND